MKKLLLKIASILAAAAMVFSFSACDQLASDLEDLLDEVVRQLEELVEDIEYITENFENFTPPISGDGELSDEWVGEDLDAIFTQPESVINFDKGYSEENEHGKIRSNVAELGSMADMDAFVDVLVEAGYEQYHDSFSWAFYETLLLLDDGQLCMALVKDGVYIQVAYFEGEESSFNAVFAIASYDMIAVAEAENVEQEAQPEQEVQPEQETGGEGGSAE